MGIACHAEHHASGPADYLIGPLGELRRSGEPRARAIRAFRLCEAVLGWRDQGIGTGLFVGLPWFYGPEKGENNLNVSLDKIVRMFVECVHGNDGCSHEGVE
jgi:hypothetical protein